MADPIEAHYTPDGDDWTVAVTGRGRTLTGRAPGLIAARDRADQLVEQLAPEESGRKTVVHLLNGDAVEFTTAYLTARLARTEEPAPTAETTEDRPAVEGEPEQQAPTAEEDTPDSPEPAAESPGVTGPVGAVRGADQAVPGPAAPAESTAAVGRPTPRPRTESQTARPAAHPVPAPEEEAAPSGS